MKIPDAFPLDRFAEDPWSLDLEERIQLLRAQKGSQARWLPRLQRLVEPPLPGAGFPAFALELPRFAHLRSVVAEATNIAELATDLADELQRFTDLYHTWSTRLDPAWHCSGAAEMIAP